MLANGGVNVARRVGCGKSPREHMEVVYFDFPAAREIGLPSEIGGEMPRHGCDEHEQRKFDQVLRVVHQEAVDRRIEEECRRSDTRNRRDNRRRDPQLRRRDDNWDQVDESNVPQGKELVQYQ